MAFRFASAIVPLALVSAALAQTYSATYLPSNAPDHSEEGQTGTNKCGTTSSPSSNCQNVYVNSIDDFCLFAPPEPGADSDIGNTERIEVAWCMKDGYGTRLIPDGTISGAHFIQTPDYVQVLGVGDLTKINIPAGDQGGELDPHGADGNGNPIGGLVFTTAFGELQQAHEWTNFMAANEFCIRVCKDGPKAPALCQHIYDVMGCEWNMPGDYSAGSFDQCQGDTGEPMGVYGTSTFHQGQPSTPDAHPAPPKSMCTPVGSIKNGVAPITGSTTSTSGGSSATTAKTTGRTSAPSAPSSTTSSSTGASQTAKPSTNAAALNHSTVFDLGVVVVSAVLGAVFIL
ncbi:uncharacterized protein BXZ73DRAFT_75053 [Epithele typhae]|uniref:uncharacterized protein n=1 Tax=Epithele typhae TaxID=378194 RepID=UPI0020072223|nr:uncharacterized protein BXZ73DRAFT_75053 [Epithele typhae]KAH9941889.1 hypothetical protein BXZ73DRAFT_75053 [Epithele typhae]